MSGRPNSTSTSTPSSSSSDKAVLDALLKLKEQQQQQQAQDSSATRSHPNAAVLSPSNNTNAPLPHIPQSLPGLSSPFVSNLGIHPSLLGLLSNMDHQQNHFLASQLAAVAQSGTAAPPLMPSSPMVSLSQQIQAMQQVAASLPNRSNSTSMQLPTEATSTEHTASSTKHISSTSPAGTAQSQTWPSGDKRGSPTTAAAAIDTTTTANVRTDKVEQALRSKPQRGKRRDDLSEKERLELTRTRNREHAKSTRLRKKARYQELLDSEQLLKQFQEVEELRGERMVCLQKFLAMREAMLNGVATENEASHSSPSIVVVPELQEVLEDVETFSYEMHGQRTMSNNVSSASLQHETDHQHGVLLKMQLWDRDIHERFRFSPGNGGDHGVPPSSSFRYILQGGPNGVAVSENGTGFARVDLELKPNPDSSTGEGGENGAKPVLSGILTVHFAPSSSRLSSAIWTTTHYAPSFSVHFSRSHVAAGVEAGQAAAPPRDDPSSSSNDSTLENQMIHPSVVSLEIKVSHTDTTESQSPGPGMSI